MARIVGYTRVSTAGQLDGFGLDAQEQAVRRWARTSGHRLVAVLADRGVSGSNGVEDREALPQVLELVKTGAADGVVVARLDRLARALTVQEAILAKVWSYGGAVYTVDGGEVMRDDPDDPMRTAMRQMVGVFAQLDRAMLVKRLRDGRAVKAGLGRYAGGQPGYGWRAEDGELAVNADEAAILHRVAELRAGGLSYRRVCSVLTAEGYATRGGGPWQPAVVRRIALRDQQPGGNATTPRQRTVTQD